MAVSTVSQREIVVYDTYQSLDISKFYFRKFLNFPDLFSFFASKC